MQDNTHARSDATSRSHLFTVRLWYEHLGDGEREWRGKVEHIPSRETRYFCTWETLIAFLLELLSQEEAQAEGQGKEPEHQGKEE